MEPITIVAIAGLLVLYFKGKGITPQTAHVSQPGAPTASNAAQPAGSVIQPSVSTGNTTGFTSAKQANAAGSLATGSPPNAQAVTLDQVWSPNVQPSTPAQAALDAGATEAPGWLIPVVSMVPGVGTAIAIGTKLGNVSAGLNSTEQTQPGGAYQTFDPVTGWAIDPTTGQLIDPNTGTLTGLYPQNPGATPTPVPTQNEPSPTPSGPTDPALDPNYTTSDLYNAQQIAASILAGQESQPGTPAA